MALISNGINGGFGGKVGTVVGYFRLGKWVIRGLPKTSMKNKRGSPAQKASRSVFTKTQQLLAPMLPFIRIGFNMEGRSKMMTGHNAAKSYNMLHAFNVDGEIDFSKVMLTYGNLPSALNAGVEKDDAGLHFSWMDNSAENLADPTDQVMLLAYDDLITNQLGEKEPEAYYLLSGARRKVGTETLELSKRSKGHTLHAYIAFISDDRQRISMTTYVGEIDC